MLVIVWAGKSWRCFYLPIALVFLNRIRRSEKEETRKQTLRSRWMACTSACLSRSHARLSSTFSNLAAQNTSEGWGINGWWLRCAKCAKPTRNAKSARRCKSTRIPSRTERCARIVVQPLHRARITSGTRIRVSWVAKDSLFGRRRLTSWYATR